MYFTYILFSKKLNKYYKGYTSNVNARLQQHNSGSESFTSSGRPWILILAIPKSTRKEAMALERKLKNLNKNRLLEFIQKYSKKRNE